MAARSIEWSRSAPSTKPPAPSCTTENRPESVVMVQSTLAEVPLTWTTRPLSEPNHAAVDGVRRPRVVAAADRHHGRQHGEHDDDGHRAGVPRR